MSGFEVEIWGARGSVVSSDANQRRTGSNTTCVAVTVAGHVTILDAGTGLVPLGKFLGADRPHDLSLFLTHYHYDHVQGLNFFAPLASDQTKFTIHAGTAHSKDSTEDVLDALFSPPFCPNKLTGYPAQITFGSFADRQPIPIDGGAMLIPYQLNHPSAAYGFRIEYQGKVFAFAPDFELGDPAGDTALAALVQDADLALLDAMFTVDELETRRGYGHSTWGEVAQICARANVASWQMFHHSPCRTDDQLDAMEAALRQKFPTCGAARERDRYVL